jgi:hypothetical protein
MTVDEAPPALDPDSIRIDYGEPDLVLGALVASVGRIDGLEIGITLHVSGVIVSGLMISAASFFDHVGKQIAESGTAAEAADRAEFGSIFTGIADLIREGAEGDDEDGGAVPAYIHLRAATVHAPGAGDCLPAALWRGRTAHVSGWSIGNYGSKV